MKTSKLFITSLLAAAAMSAVPAWATDYTVTGAFTGGQSNDNLTGTIDGTRQTITLSSGDTLTFSGATSGYFPKWGGGGRTVAANIVISNRGSITINDGDSGSYMIFSGSVSGAGDFIVNGSKDPAKGQDFIFTGNLTAFTGGFSRPVANFNASGTDFYNNSNTGILQFGGTVSSDGIGAGTAYVASATAGTDGIVHNISGTNQSTITTTSVLRYNYTGSANEDVTALGIDNSSISARYLDFRGGANYTVSSAVSGNNATAANNTLKISAGTTTFTGSIANFGTITVASGATAKLAEGSAFNLASVASAIAISGGGNFVLAGNVSLSADASGAPLSLTAGTFSVEDTASFALTGAGRLGESVNFVSVSGGTVTAAALSTEKFTYNGHALSSRITGVSLTESGSLAFTGKALSLTWKSDLATGTWNKSDQNFTASDGTASSFVDYDDVTFATADASVTIGEAIGAEKITISENTTFSASSTNTLSASSVAVGSGKTLTLNGGISSYSFDSVSIAENATLKAIVLAAPTTTPAEGTPAEPIQNTTVDYSGVTGTGTLLLGLRADNGVGFNLSNFTGTIRVEGNTATTRGRLQLNTSTLNSAAQIVVANTGDLVFNGSGTNISNTVTFEGSSSIYVNSGKTGTLSGSLTATSGTLTKEGAGALTLSGRTDINKLIINNIGSVTYSAGTHTLGSISASEKTLTVSGASLTISGAATIGTLTQSAGTLNVTAGTTTVGTYGGLRGGSVAGALTIAAGASMSVTGGMTLRWEHENTTTLNVNGDLSVGGNLWISRDGNGIVNINDGGTVVAQTLTFGQGWNTTNPTKKSSTVNLRSGGVLVVGAVVANTTAGASGATTSLNTSALNLNGGKLGTSANSLTINVTSGSGSTAKTLSVVLGDGTTSTINTGKYDTATKTFTKAEASISIVNAISGSGALKKDGAGTLTLSGANSFTGGLEIKEGIVVSTQTYSLGAGTNVVKLSGGQLSVNADVTLAQTNIEIALSSAYATTAAIIGAAATASLAVNTTVTITDLDLTGIALVSEAALANSSYEFKILDTISAGEGLTFKLSEALENDWRISGYKNGVLTIAAIPEPSVFGLLAGLGALALAGRRRRRRKA